MDALQSGDELKRVGVADESTTTVPDLGTPQLNGYLATRQLREAGVSGVLTYSDDECRLHAVSLPELEPVRAPSFRMCRPATSTGGLGAVDGEVVWAGLGYGFVQVVLSRDELGRQISPWLRPPGTNDDLGIRAVQAVALGEERTVVLAESTYEPRERVVALVEGERVVFVQQPWVVGDARFLRPSPSGTYFAAFSSDRLRWFDRNAAPRAFPAAVRSPRTVAWSPDEHWTALATDRSVYVFPSEDPEGLLIRVPLTVRDLDWTDSPPRSDGP